MLVYLVPGYVRQNTRQYHTSSLEYQPRQAHLTIEISNRLHRFFHGRNPYAGLDLNCRIGLACIDSYYSKPVHSTEYDEYLSELVLSTGQNPFRKTWSYWILSHCY